MSGIASTADDIISVGHPLPRIASVVLIERKRVRVAWRDGRATTVDLAPVIQSHRAFIPLREDDDLFQTLRVNEDGNAICWDDEIELSAEWLERLPPVGMENVEFRQAMKTLGLTLEGMAAQLDVSRRLVASYRGVEPIPAHVALAVRYLMEHGSSAGGARGG
jgi:hypothetical protein